MKKITQSILCLSSALAVLASGVTAFAKAPSAYDNKSYESVGLQTDSGDEVINLAVIAKGDVVMGNSMKIVGSVYSNGTIYVSNSQGDVIEGLLISGTDGSTLTDWAGTVRKCDGYIHVTSVDDLTVWDNPYYYVLPELAGSVKDDDTSFECSYDAFEAPEIANDLGDVEMNVYTIGSPMTITKDTHIGALGMNGTQNNWQGIDAALTIDTSESDVTVVIDSISYVNNPSIKVVGEHNAYIYIKDTSYINNLAVNYNSSTDAANGNKDNTFIYLAGSSITLDNGIIYANTISVDADILTISGSVEIYSDIDTGAANVTVTGGQTEVHGILCAPDAHTEVTGSGIVYGSVHTDTLKIYGSGAIINEPDYAAYELETEEPTEEPTAAPTEEPTEEPTETPTEEPTEEPTETPTEEPTEAPTASSTATPAYSEPYELTNDYAYIFGRSDAFMEAEDGMKRGEVAAVLYRLLKQNNKLGDFTYDASAEPVFESLKGRWDRSALEFMTYLGIYDETAESLNGETKITRGEAFKMIAIALGFTSDTSLSEAEYALILKDYGAIDGDDADDESIENLQLDRIIKRAEMCKIYNIIIERDKNELVTADGTEVTASTYGFVDLSSDEWYYGDILRATSAFTDGYVDLEARGIRNVLDDYE